MAYRLVIFDCDGTLVDTATDVCECFNKALADCGYPEQMPSVIAGELGKVLPAIVAAILPPTAPIEAVEVVSKRYREIYKNCSLSNTHLFPGMESLIDKLAERGISVAVNSNKPQENLSKLIKSLLPGRDIRCEGYIEGRAIKPQPDSALAIIEGCSAARSETLYVGDTSIDAETANNAGISCVLVSWGQGTSKAYELPLVDKVFDNCNTLYDYIVSDD
jgi:phosphoglycolate phosphatase